MTFATRSKPALAVALALVLTGAACDVVPRERHKHGPSGERGGSYSDIVASQRDLAARHSDLVRVHEYGTSVGGRPLVMVKVGRQGKTVKPRPAVVMTQAVHGDEYLGIVDRLPKELVEKPNDYPAVKAFLDRGGIFYIVPVANPDGYEADRRENDNGKDLNRNFDVKRSSERLAASARGPIGYTEEELLALANYLNEPRFSEPETRSLATTMRLELAIDGAELKFYVDYHCCQSEKFGSLVHEWGDTRTLRDGTISTEDVTRYERARDVFLGEFPGHLFGSGYETIGYQTFGTTDEWFYETFAADRPLAFFYEGQSRGESRKLRRHAMFWEALLGEHDML